ncbi:hypothetical protein [Oceaniglobus indicus]|nr:hypothetical protein [Oceaniglobus indicus]
MEIVLGSLIEYVHGNLRRYPSVKWLLIGLLTGFGWWLVIIEWGMLGT